MDAGAALVQLVATDPHQRFGARTLQERLAAQDMHVSRSGRHSSVVAYTYFETRDWVNDFLKTMDYDAVQKRRPGAQKVHRYGLHSMGPNEEWSVDGHDKIIRTMGIGIWGVVDKFSRKILGHFAVPNNRLADTALACFLLVVQRAGGKIILCWIITRL